MAGQQITAFSFVLRGLFIYKCGGLCERGGREGEWSWWWWTGTSQIKRLTYTFDLKNSFRPSTIKYTQSPPAL